jgi:hypothetical protein
MPALHQQYVDIARAYIDDFVSKKLDDRQVLLATVTAEIQAHSEKNGLPLPSNLKTVSSIISLMCLLTASPSQKVENWFHNHRPHTAKKPKDNQNSKNALVNWSVRKVVQQTRRDEIKQRMAMNAPGITRDHKDWIASYHHACTEVIKGLSLAEKTACENTAEEWNATGPDPQTQA